MPGDVPIIQNKAKIVCRFPRIPFATLADRSALHREDQLELDPQLQCRITPPARDANGDRPTTRRWAGTEHGVSIRVQPRSDREPGWHGGDFFPLPDNSGYAPITDAAGMGTRPYKSVDFAQLFAQITF